MTEIVERAYAVVDARRRQGGVQQGPPDLGGVDAAALRVAEHAVVVALVQGALVVPLELVEEDRRERDRSAARLRLRLSTRSFFSPNDTSRQRSSCSSDLRSPVTASVRKIVRACLSVNALAIVRTSAGCKIRQPRRLRRAGGGARDRLPGRPAAAVVVPSAERLGGRHRLRPARQGRLGARGGAAFDDSLVTYPVAIAETRCNYGGTRPWFLCPARGCGRRVRKLYLGNRYFACRHCYRLRYASQTEHRRERLERRRYKLIRRMGGDGERWPERPHGMHRSTYDALLERRDLIAARLSSAARMTSATTAARNL
jgi:hypothetical protein